MLKSIVFVGFLLPSVSGHVALSFPPARWPPYDFLDVTRTQGPCGVPKSGNSVRTTLRAGDLYNITWRMAYPNRGGFKLYLLDSDEKPLMRLTPIAGRSAFVGLGREDERTETVRLPRVACADCSVQLERQALDYGASVWFWSCADVTIELDDAAEPADLCMNGAAATSDGECACDRLFSGELCQHRDICWDDGDCNDRGSCVHLNTTDYYPSRACYCDARFFGDACQHEFVPQPLDLAFNCFNYEAKDETTDLMTSAIDPLPSAAILDTPLLYNFFSPACYHSHPLSDGDTLYWRRVADDVEVVLDMAGSSWVALGWRPLNMTTACRRFPVDSTKKHRPPTAAPPPPSFQPQFELPVYRPNPMQFPQPAPFPQMPVQQQQNVWYQPYPAGGQNRPNAPLPVYVPPGQQNYQYQWQSPHNGTMQRGKRSFNWLWHSEQLKWVWVDLKDLNATDSSTPVPPPLPAGITTTTDRPPPTTTTTTTLVPTTTTTTTREPMTTAPPTPPTAPAGAQADNTREVATTAAGEDDEPLHEMDCTDMVVASAAGRRGRVADYYARDRSTPLTDALLGGADSLSAAYALATHTGRTLVMFRKPIRATDPFDHPLGPGEMHVIWAKGNAQPYSHATDAASIDHAAFYTPKRLMYHGKQNRGHFRLQFVA